MIWLTWRQHRRQALFAAVAVAVLAAIMVPTGLAMHHAFTRSGLADCLAKLGTAPLIPASPHDCHNLSANFHRQFDGLTSVAILFVVLPVLAGLFFGAPLVAREIEHGTHRLVWTQGVSRGRWALIKFGLVGTGTVVLAAAYALGVSWWFGPLVKSGSGRLGYLAFDVQGIAPVAYTLFAVALGVCAGTVWPRLLPAMGVTLVGFLGVRVLIEVVARPRYMAPETLTFALESSQQPNPAAGNWVYDEGVRNAAGQLVAEGARMSCTPGGCTQEGSALGPGAYNWQLYQPDSRFWAFQWIETSIFLALAALLILVALRRLRRLA